MDKSASVEIRVIDAAPRAMREEPELPAFVPIEDSCPQWVMARVIVEAAIPETLEFSIGSNHTSAALNTYAIQRLWIAAPEEDKVAIAARILALNDFMGQIIDPTPFERFVGRPANQQSLSELNYELQSQDDAREAAGLPRFPAVMRHFLGIKNVGMLKVICYGP